MTDNNQRLRIEIVPDPQALATRAMEEFLRLAEDTLRSKNRFAVALAGGSTPRRMYSLLAKQDMDWTRVHFFWGDERSVPPSNPDSNYCMADEALLSYISIPETNIHRIHGELPAEKAAKEYETELKRFFEDRLPRFDLILLGLGGDGHTASLFPGTNAIKEKKRWAIAIRHIVPPLPLVDRVTLTLPVINAANQILFLVSGAEKAQRLCQVLQGPYQPGLQPAQAVKPEEGDIHWLVDRDAAQMI
jgi:6-phosphogluconolactonase